MPLSIPLVGAVDAPPSVQGHWRFDVSVAGGATSVDFNVDGDVLAQADVDAVAPFLAKVDEFDRLARRMFEELREDGAVASYVEHHLEEFDAADLTGLFGTADPAAIDARRFLSKLALHRIGLYPDAEDASAVFDYTIGRGLTQYVLTVGFDREGDVVAVEMES